MKFTSDDVCFCCGFLCAIVFALGYEIVVMLIKRRKQANFDTEQEAEQEAELIAKLKAEQDSEIELLQFQKELAERRAANKAWIIKELAELKEFSIKNKKHE